VLAVGTHDPDAADLQGPAVFHVAHRRSNVTDAQVTLPSYLRADFDTYFGSGAAAAIAAASGAQAAGAAAGAPEAAAAATGNVIERSPPGAAGGATGASVSPQPPSPPTDSPHAGASGPAAVTVGSPLAACGPRRGSLPLTAASSPEVPPPDSPVAAAGAAHVGLEFMDEDAEAPCGREAVAEAAPPEGVGGLAAQQPAGSGGGGGGEPSMQAGGPVARQQAPGLAAQPQLSAGQSEAGRQPEADGMQEAASPAAAPAALVPVFRSRLGRMLLPPAAEAAEAAEEDGVEESGGTAALHMMSGVAPLWLWHHVGASALHNANMPGLQLRW